MKNYNEKETNKFGTYYFLDNLLHRTDGPAAEFSDEDKQWWINGELIGASYEGFTKKDFEQYKKLLLLK